MREGRVFWVFFALFFLGSSSSAATHKIAAPNEGGGYQDFQGINRANEIGMADDATVLDSQTQSKLQNLQYSEHATPALKQAIDQLLRMNAISAQSASSLPPPEEDGIGYSRIHGFKNKELRPGGAGRRGRKKRILPGDDQELFEARIPLDLGSRRNSIRGDAPSAPRVNTGRPLEAPPSRREGLSARRARSRTRGEAKPSLSPIERVRRSIRGRRFARVIEGLGGILSQDPRDAEARALLALVLFELGRYAAAIAAADHALRLHPESAETYFVRALAFEQIGMEARKMMDLRQAAKLDPARFGSYLQRVQEGERRIFDPSIGDRFRLIDAIDPVRPGVGRRTGGMILAILLLAGLTGLLLWGLPKRLRLAARSGTAPRTGRFADFWAGRQKAPAVLTPSSAPVRAAQKLRKQQVLANKYRLSHYLGRDGTVEVWRAQDQSLDRPAVLMRLYTGPEQSEERERRMAEARSSATLHHPNVVDVYEVLDLPQGLFIVHEHCSGKSVRQVLGKTGKIPLSQVGGILIPVCRALEHAHHRGVVHGGLSPERILITKEGYIKVSHFVLARTTGEGAERYAAPEAKRGELKAVSDVYSLALCCYEMLAGAPPGDPDGELDEKIESLLEPALDLDHRTRTPSAKKFLRILRRLAAQPGTSTETTA